MTFRLPLLVAVAASLAACKTEAPPTTSQAEQPAEREDRPELSPPPKTKRVAVTDEHHGTKVTEHYRWLEDGEDPEVQSWTKAQNERARTFLDDIPGRKAVAKRVTEVMKADSVVHRSVSPIAGRVFALKRDPPKQQPFLVVMPSVNAPEKAEVVVDPNAMDEAGTTHIDWYRPSPDGELVAVSLSKAGTESGDVHIYETDTGEQVHEVIPRVNGGTAGGDLAWSADGSGFFYTRYPRGDERPEEDRNFYQQLYYHRLGTPTEKDRYELGKGFPKIAEIRVRLHEPSGRALVTVQKGDGGEFALFLRSKKGKWTQFSEYGDKILAASFGTHDDLYLLSRQEAPKGKITRMPISSLNPSKAEVVVPEAGDATIVENFWGAPTIVVTDARIFTLYQLGGPSEIRVFDHDGERLEGPEHLDVAAVYSIIPLEGGDILFPQTSYTEPLAYWTYDADEKKTEKTALATESPMDTSAVEVRRETTQSKDGTEIPVNILKREDVKKDGTAACVVYGYGGYGVSLSPGFRSRNLMFVERGVVYAVANIRGGGEFGERWHREGNLTNKQNVFDDFHAAVKHMVAEKYCDADRVGILGGSNGGLLMGATLVQHPDLAEAVVSFVGIYDMLRVELSPNGQFNITEFGTVKNPEHFEALYAYSPYHNVEDETPYPAVLFITGENDPRVDPMQSRKMTARLQAASSSEEPVLLRVSADAGHGGSTGLDERIAQYTDMYAFFFHELGVNPVAKTNGRATVSQ